VEVIIAGRPRDARSTAATITCSPSPRRSLASWSPPTRTGTSRAWVRPISSPAPTSLAFVGSYDHGQELADPPATRSPAEARSLRPWRWDEAEWTALTAGREADGGQSDSAEVRRGPRNGAVQGPASGARAERRTGEASPIASNSRMHSPRSPPRPVRSRRLRPL